MGGRPLGRGKAWPHKNAPQDIAARRQALRASRYWDARCEAVLQPPPTLPAEDLETYTRVHECLTGFVTLPVATVPVDLNLGLYTVDESGAVRESGRESASVYVPLAHSEGGLSASLLRGANATRAAGGVRTYVLADAMTRASCFQFADVAEAVVFQRWVEANAAEMIAWLRDPANELRERRTATGVRVISRHAVLREVTTHVLGNYCHVLYRFTTGDACGPNMITRNAQAINKEFIAARFPAQTGTPIRRRVLEANMGGDKKPSYQFFREGHGKTVLAEATLDERVLSRHLHCSVEDIVALCHLGLHGSHASGMQSAAFTPASTVAAIFAATGQDLGMVGTSSMAHSTAEASGNGVHLSIRLPGLEVGTVGGGTVLPHAQAWLQLMGCQGPGSAYRFAQIVAAATLCLEISAAAAMAADGSENFYRAHLELGGVRTRCSVPLEFEKDTAAPPDAD